MMTTEPKKKRVKKVEELEMKFFTCIGCGQKKFDWNEQCTGITSIKCLWCAKYPKQKIRTPIKDEK